ncbi:MAG: hypothetical protein ABIH46_04800 [Chloroflexota bacterium]
MAVGEVKATVERSGSYVEVKVSQERPCLCSVVYRMVTPLFASSPVWVEKIMSEPRGNYTEAQEGLGSVPWPFLAAAVEALMEALHNEWRENPSESSGVHDYSERERAACQETAKQVFVHL